MRRILNVTVLMYLIAAGTGVTEIYIMDMNYPTFALMLAILTFFGSICQYSAYLDNKEEEKIEPLNYKEHKPIFKKGDIVTCVDSFPYGLNHDFYEICKVYPDFNVDVVTFPEGHGVGFTCLRPQRFLKCVRA